MLDQATRFTLRNRYHFTGELVMKTALHIGGGRSTLSHSNNPVVLTPAGTPFIPGSSFKGALRSTVEKLIPNLPGLTACALIELPANAHSTKRPSKEQRPRWPQGVCPTTWQSGLTALKREAQNREEEAALLQEALENLCHTCRLFGSPLAAARLSISDLYMESTWAGGIEIRDGVAIDRDSEKARDRLKYDFEVVPASAAFKLALVLENATSEDLLLISVGLSEFVQGYGILGGKRSRGLGACELRELKVSSLELTDIEPGERTKRLAAYLTKREFPDQQKDEPGEAFLTRQIQSFLKNVAER